MKIQLIAVGTKMPAWVEHGFEEYRRRFPKDMPWTTEQLAVQLEAWKLDGRDVALLVGGPEGLSPECKAAAEQSWSLSPLTLPHPLVRVLVAESLYRAWSITTNHPYHRE